MQNQNKHEKMKRKKKYKKELHKSAYKVYSSPLPTIKS
jgi:hypothetical protein